MGYEHVVYEVSGAVGVITLNRPEAANAQSRKALEELDAAWQAAGSDPAVKVIVFKSKGKHFSAGHDMSATKDMSAPVEWDPDSHYEWEKSHYLRYAKAWREIPKPSIAAVQGKCIAAGLMLCWPCDLIVAADNAEFSDPVLRLGICGVEFHAHTWEFGPRKAKELLFTGEAITAQEAMQLGMVNRVVPLAELVPATMALAQKIAKQDAFALRMAKEAVNLALDMQQFNNSIDAIFKMHQLGHTRAAFKHPEAWPVLASQADMQAANKGKT